MTLLLIALAALAQDAKKEPVPFLPADGRARIFTVTKPVQGKDPRVETWTLAPAGDLKGVELVHYEPMEPFGRTSRVSQRKDPKDPGLFAMRKDGTVQWVLEDKAGELRIFVGARQYPLAWTFPADCGDALKWTARQTYMSCGFGARSLDFEAKAEQVTVAAGTFDALRVEISCESRPCGKDGVVQRVTCGTLWVARGQGLLKADVDGRVIELKEIAPAPVR